jgi:hypothetical protein
VVLLQPPAQGAKIDGASPALAAAQGINGIRGGYAGKKRPDIPGRHLRFAAVPGAANAHEQGDHVGQFDFLWPLVLLLAIATETEECIFALDGNLPW